MRTLLIDNYDSFTYNLYQYLAACNGRAPIVVRNDELTWEEVEERDFDNIVISPGPGRPQNPSDLGLSADALRRSDKPVLGVCLGHQAIAHHCGAKVDLASRPMHGRIDRIFHGQRELFRGIPDRFEAVRYHSLAVSELPGNLEPLAWAGDGTLMALRHQSRPWWGVQFHPESICSEYGARLLRNFHDLTVEWLAAPSPGSTLASFVPETRRGIPALHVHASCVDAMRPADEVFTEVYGGSPHAFWLDSSLADGERSRFSFMGDASGPRSEHLLYRSATRELVVRRGGVDQVLQQSVFDYLKERLRPAPIGQAQLPFDFSGGYVGYFGYELKQELGSQRGHDADTPDACWIFADRFLAFDHMLEQTWVVCLDESVPNEANQGWIAAMHAVLGRAPSNLEDRPAPPAPAAPRLSALRWQVDLVDYRDLIAQCQHEIIQGETYEVCLTNQLVAQGSIEPLAVYLQLRQANPAPYAAYLRSGSLAVLCASPELFLRLDAHRTVDSRPIKGTAARAATPEEDRQVARDLLEDEKTRAEHLMIVDLLRNDLNRVCDVDTVHVPELFQIETYATVHQMVSTIRGQLPAQADVIDLVRAAFPGGSMTGAPKLRTLSILDRLEAGPRGVYSGSLGYLSLSGTAQLNIVIRTIVSTGEQVSVGAGGAIVALSDPDAEVDEIVLKAHAMQHVLRGARNPEASPST
jgi:para-aminobenzoate synthetase